MNTRRLLIIVGCIGMIVIGFYFNFEHYQSTMIPLNLATDNLKNIVRSSEPTVILTNLFELKQNLMQVMERLPENKNPVWLFPTESTNFLRMDASVDSLITMIETISTIPIDNSAHHTGMLDMNARSDNLRENIIDSKGFLYASPANVFFTLVWLFGVVGLTQVWIRK